MPPVDSWPPDSSHNAEVNNSMRTSLLLVICLICVASLAAQPEIQVGKVTPASVAWGPQVLNAEITNKAEYPKLVSAIMSIKFTGNYLNPVRKYRSNYFVEPDARATMPVSFEIPMNFGTAKMTLAFYDVVDTLDPIFPEQLVSESHYELIFHVPEEVLPYTQERITTPPLTDRSPVLDAEYDRIALWMFHEGRSKEEIAAAARVDTAYFNSLVKKWLHFNFLAKSKLDSTLRPTFVCVDIAGVEEAKPLAEETSTKLAAILERNIKANYSRVLDSLVRAGVTARDSNDFLNGGTILYRKYPVVAGLLLWYDWGRGFIVGPGILDVLEGTDPCNVMQPTYMYAVQGGDVFNGHHYFRMMSAAGKVQINFADSIPEVSCPEIYPFLDYLRDDLGFGYSVQSSPEFFSFDTTAANPMIRALSEGSTETLNAAFTGLKTILEKHQPGSFTTGARYWFWNLVATRTLDKLLKNEVLERRGNGHFRVEAL